jgi:predicted transcriptional regulator
MATAVSVKLSDDERARLAIVAKKTKRSAHYIMREALSGHLAYLEWRLDFIKEAEDALDDYHATGLHLTLEDMETWAKSGMGELPPWRK